MRYSLNSLTPRLDKQESAERARRREYIILLSKVLLADALAVAVSAMLTLGVHRTTAWTELVLPTVMCVVLWFALSIHAGLYRQTTVRIPLLDIPRIVSTTLQGGALVLAFLALRHQGEFQSALLGTLVLISVPTRVATRVILQRLGASPCSRMVIIGAGVVGQRLAANLIKYSDLGVTVVGFIDEHEYAQGARRLLNIPVYTAEHLERVLIEKEVDHVVFAFSRMPDSDRLAILRVCQHYKQVQISLIPRLFEGMPAKTRLLAIRSIPLIQFETSGQVLELIAKRVIDVVVSGLGLLILAPFLLIMALAIYLDDPGPVLFRQKRVGGDGASFTMYKLRSMRDHQPGELVHATTRYTRIGTVLRKTSLDELPQLWNVFCGDMSLVGPRPEQEDYVHLFSDSIPRYAERHRMRVGITGLSQVNHLRGDTSVVERTRLDNFYIDNWSLWLDIKVLLLTFTTIVPMSQGIGGDAMLRDIVAEVAQEPASAEHIQILTMEDEFLPNLETPY